MLLSLSLTALAYDTDALSERLEQIEPLRDQRIASISPAIPDRAYRTAAAGRIATGVSRIEGDGPKLGWGVGILEVGIDALWAGLNDETHFGDLVPLSHTEIVRGLPCADQRLVLMVLPLPVVADRWWINQNRYNLELQASTGGQVRELSWRSVSDPEQHDLSEEARAAVEGRVPVEFNHGAWFLVALDDDHTLAEYHSWVDPGGSIPAKGASLFAASGISDTFEAMERHARRRPLHCLEAP